MSHIFDNALITIGEGSDFNITWVDDFAILRDIETLLESASVSSGNVSKAALLNVLNPELRYCVDRCDSSIESVSELIEAFTFLEATILHNRQMHASLNQKININESGFVLIPLKTSHYIIKRVYFNNIVILNPINIIIKKFCRVIVTSPN